ncbi:MAG: glycosyltransferase family 4 protein [Blautia sp.]|nr:glycosyltransferase family 4 protein [Blautia sp.]MCM1200891.1 glycosyltransferase family 4 protein [Bacteroides fragilis]
MKILILTNYANGLWLFRKELLLAFLEDGHEVSVSLPPDENVARLETLAFRQNRIRIVETPFERRGTNPIKDFGLFRAYLGLLKRLKPDVALTYTIKPNLYGGLACRFKKVPYLCNITGLGAAVEEDGLMSRLLSRFYRVAVKKAECVFFQNGKDRDFMLRRKIAVHNHKVLPGSGVNLKEHPFAEYPSEKNGLVFLTVIRIIEYKGIREYLEAVRIMHERHKDVRFCLVGEYEEDVRKDYEPQINELEKKGVLQYLGHRDDVPALMAASHVIVHPSYSEGIANVLLEAASCGRPVIASNISGCVETFLEGKSGFSFTVRNTDALIEAMEKILALSGEERKRMGIEGRAWVEKNFDRALVIQAYRDRIAELEHRKKK